MPPPERTTARSRWPETRTRLLCPRGVGASAGASQRSPTSVPRRMELWEDSGDDDRGWYCVRTDPFPCPAEGCSFVADFMAIMAHLVLVWEERDDLNLPLARAACEGGRKEPSGRRVRARLRAQRFVLRLGGRGRPYG